MSTSESQIIARALYDSLINSTLQSLRVAAEKLAGASSAGLEQRLTTALPPDMPREVNNFLATLAQGKLLGQLPQIVREFEQYAHANTQRALTGEVISAVELEVAQRTQIGQQLSDRYGSKIELRFSVDPSLIGGLIIRIGDQVLDNSLRARLSAVQRNMQSS